MFTTPIDNAAPADPWSEDFAPDQPPASRFDGLFFWALLGAALLIAYSAGFIVGRFV